MKQSCDCTDYPGRLNVGFRQLKPNGKYIEPERPQRINKQLLF